MWIARDIVGNLLLFNIKPFRTDTTWWFDRPEDINERDDEAMSRLWMRLDSNLFPELKWEDEPSEIVIYERFPVHETTCSKCGTTFKYTDKDVEITTNENPWEAGYIEEDKWVKCPECGKYIRVF